MYVRTSVIIELHKPLNAVTGNHTILILQVLFNTFISERDCTPLQLFYKDCIQSKQQLALVRLMHSV
jgi:hypothetical protein